MRQQLIAKHPVQIDFPRAHLYGINSVYKSIKPLFKCIHIPEIIKCL